MLKLILEWLIGYLAVGLMIALAGLCLVAQSEKKAIEAFEARKDRGEAPWCFCRPPRISQPISPVKVFLLVALAVPRLIWIAAGDLLRVWRVRRQEAWERSPEGLTELERRCRRAIEEEVAPWVPLEWITERNLPWREFEADYKDSRNWSPRARDAFELLWQRVSEQDEVAYFRTPPETWRKLFGRAGWVVLRDGKVIGQIVIIMN